MAKKNDKYYFQNFIKCVDCSCRAARMLDGILADFDAATLTDKLDEIHAIEHEADSLKHESMAALIKAFITPIEREDIMSLSQNIDEVTDTIEDVLIRVYTNNVTSIRPEVHSFTALIIESCDTLKQLMVEFEDFKRSKEIHTFIIRINELEEDVDRLFLSSMHELHSACNNPLEVIAWREIFYYLEICADACEHVADVVEGVVMKNS